MGSLRFEFNCDQSQKAFEQVNGNPFCKVCKTTVWDLRDKSKKEIIDLVSSGDGQLCGQFFMEQITAEPPVRSRVNLKLFFASVTAFFTLNSTKIYSQTKDTIKTEQHSNRPTETKDSEKQTSIPDTACVTYEKGTPVSTAEQNRKKRIQFLVIGRRHFYLTAQFPFIISRRVFKGRFKY